MKEYTLSMSEPVPNEVIEQVYSFYSSFMLLVEDACNAAAYLYVMQGLFPRLFDTMKPFTEIELLLLSGNLALPSFLSSPQTHVEVDSNMKSNGVEVDSNMKSNGVESDGVAVSSQSVQSNQSVQPSQSSQSVQSSQPPLSQPTTLQITEVVGLHGLPGHENKEPRKCDLCSLFGDHPIAGRLICSLTGEWVHVNCVYYSSAISTDEKTGAIQKYNLVKSQSRNSVCCVCKRPGATLRCHYPGCSHCFHFVCGYESDCFIRISREAFCPAHNPPSYRRNTKDMNNPLDKAIFSSLSKPLQQQQPSYNSISSMLTQRPSMNYQDYRALVNSAELFTCRLNYRIVFPSVKL